MLVISVVASTSDPTPVTVGLVEFILIVVGGVATVCVFVFDQFRRTRETARKELEKAINAQASSFKEVIDTQAKQLQAFKLWSYRVLSLHNREDDENFGAINDNIHDICLRNARIDGVHERDIKFKSIRKRRTLVADGGDISTQEVKQNLDRDVQHVAQEFGDYEGGG